MNHGLQERELNRLEKQQTGGELVESLSLAGGSSDLIYRPTGGRARTAGRCWDNGRFSVDNGSTYTELGR